MQLPAGKTITYESDHLYIVHQGGTVNDAVVLEDNAWVQLDDGVDVHFTNNVTVGRNAGFVLGEGSAITIDGNAVISAGARIVVPDNASIVTNGGTGKLIQIKEDARFEMGLNAAITFKSKVDARGTPAAPIRFERFGENAWNRVGLLADGNYFEYAVFDGGTKNVDVASKNNTFKHVRSVDGWRGFSSGYDYTGGGRSSFTLNNVVIDNSSTVGLVGYHADITMQYSTVTNSGQAGIWLTDASAGSFRYNDVEQNGRTSSTSSGIEVNSGGNLSTTTPGSGGPGVNLIKSNAYHEVYIASGGAASLGTGYLSGSRNGIYDPSDVSTTDAERFVYNGSSGRVYAKFDYWGTSTLPPAGHFYGDVYLGGTYSTSGPTDVGAEGVPLMIESSAPALFASTEVTAVPTSDASDEMGITVAGPSDDVQALMKQIREALSANPGRSDAVRLLHDLFNLQLTDRMDVLGQKQANMAVIASFRARLAKGNNSQAGGTAALLEIRDAMLGERYDEAARMLSSYDVLIEHADNRRHLLLEKTFLLEQKGDYAGALAAFEKFKTIQSSHASLSGYTPADYSIVERTLNEELGNVLAVADDAALRPGIEGQAGDSTRSISKSLTANGPQSLSKIKTALGDESIPKEFGLGQSYPNPFNEISTIPFTLPEESKVHIEVFDVMGRRVAVLANQSYPAGKHTVRFDAGYLGSGQYLVRARFEGVSGKSVRFVKMLTLMK